MDIHARIYQKLYEVRMQDRLPNALYLGVEELLELKNRKDFFHFCNVQPPRRPTYADLPVFEVDARSHLAVGH